MASETSGAVPLVSKDSVEKGVFLEEYFFDDTASS
jgi:hypothetical protein